MTLMTRIKLFVIVLVLAFMSQTPAKAHGSDGAAVTIVTGIIGYQLGQRSVQPTVIYQPIPMPYQPAPAVIENPNSGAYGYCGGYKNEQYYQCLGNLQRQRNAEAYQRGLMGY